MNQDDPKNEALFRLKLTPEEYYVLRQAGTEPPFGDAYEKFKKEGAGIYVCRACDAELFTSDHKFDSGCGWPSFYDPKTSEAVLTRADHSGGRARVEVLCAACSSHLGHVFEGEGFDTPTDKRYCINAIAIRRTT